MGFWKAFGNAAGSAAGSSIGSGLEHKIHGNDVARAGHRLDNRYYLKRQDASFRLAKSHGLTAQEFYGSAASSGSGGPGGAAQVLGNMNTQSQQAFASSMQNQMMMQNQQNIANTNKDAMLGAASKTADAAVKTAQIQDRFKRDQLGLERGKYQDERKLLANEVVNTMPEWVKRSIILKMGPDNMIIGALADKHNLDLSNPNSIKNAPEGVLDEFLDEVLEQTSKTNREGQGILKVLEGILKWAQDELPDDRREGESWLQRLQKYIRGSWQDAYDKDGNKIEPQDSYPDDASS